MDFLKRAWAEIHLDRLKENISNYRRYIGEGTKVMCVVKADCYGHGSPVCSKYLQDSAGIDSFAVSNLNEALELREAGITGDILILGYTPPQHACSLSAGGLIQTITDVDYAKELSEAASETVKCHIKLDTGMSRLGLRYCDTEDHIRDISEIMKLKNLSVEGIFTHLSSADSPDGESVEFTNSQIKLFDSICDKAQQLFPAIKQRHYMNSAGGVRFPDKENKVTLARLGIILYGLTPDRQLSLPFELHQVMELKAVVSQVKIIPEGSSVSYGRTFTAPKDMKIAVIAAGYADGVPRLLSNKGEVIISGRKAPIIGRVCMDQLIVDAEGVDVRPGDTAVLIGSDGGEKITADDIAEKCSTIGYEVVCGITKRVPRVYFDKEERYSLG